MPTGKFQNPWLESRVSENSRDGIATARRNSGGGTVYHDAGNLNLTFFTSRQRYDRKRNLKLIVRALRRDFDVPIEISDREDLVIGDHKVSGTASKVARTVAYHHCTLLVSSDKKTLSEALRSSDFDRIKTNASKSIKSQIKNLADVDPNITVARLINSISSEYSNDSQPDSVDPSEANFPGISELREEFESFEWIFGNTPDFTVTKTVTADSPNSIEIEVVKGIVWNLKINSSETDWFRGKKFHDDLFATIENQLKSKLTKAEYKQLKNL